MRPPPGNPEVHVGLVAGGWAFQPYVRPLNTHDNRYEDDRSEMSRVSCTSGRLRELIRQTMNPQGQSSQSETAPKETAEQKCPPFRWDHPVSASRHTNVPVSLAATPGPQPLATSIASSGLAKPKKLRGFSGGKTETYRAHLETVWHVNACEDSTTLANIAAELSGPALDYYSSLPSGDMKEYSKVLEVMSQRFSSLANPRAIWRSFGRGLTKALRT